MTDAPKRGTRTRTFWTVLVFRDMRKFWEATQVEADVDEDGNFEAEGRAFHIDGMYVNDDRGIKDTSYVAYEQPWRETKKRYENYEGPLDNPARWVTEPPDIANPSDVAIVTVAPNEAVAGMLCSTLRAEGIDCAHKHAGGAFPYGAVGGARLILVPARDAERARALLDALSNAP